VFVISALALRRVSSVIFSKRYDLKPVPKKGFKYRSPLPVSSKLIKFVFIASLDVYVELKTPFPENGKETPIAFRL
jgi:hypothetical protein